MNPSRPAEKASRPGALVRARLACEVAGVFVVGPLIGYFAAMALGVRLKNPLQALNGRPAETELFTLTRALAEVLVFQYVGWAVLIVFFALSSTRALPVRLGLGSKPAGGAFGTEGWGPARLFAAGALGACLLALPSMAINFVQFHVTPLGQTAAWRQILLTLPPTPAWWTLMAVGSFGLVPIIEEAFYRGYAQGRLEQAFGAGPAIWATALLFSLSHGQYLERFDLLNGLTLASVLFFGLGVGVLRAVTGSIWPGVLVHMAVNLPLPGRWPPLVAMAALALACLVARRPILAMGKKGLALVGGTAGWALALLAGAAGAALAVANQKASDLTLLAGLVFLAAALVLALAAAVAGRRRP